MLRQPWIAAGELAAFLGLLALACMAFGTETVLSLTPSPLWIPVILLSVQHGAAAGLVAAGSGILITFLFNWPVPAEGGDYYAHWLRASMDPALWVATAALIGITRDWQISETEELRTRLQQAETRARTLDEYAGELIKRIEELERHIATGSRPSDVLLQALLEFRSDRSPLKRRMQKLFEALFGSGTFELNRIHPSRRHSDFDLEPGRIYSLFDTDNEVAASAAALYVCALQAPNGRIIGEVAILRIGEDRWDPDIDQRIALFVSEVEIACANEAHPAPRRERKKKASPSRAAKKTIRAHPGHKRGRKRRVNSPVVRSLQ